MTGSTTTRSQSLRRIIVLGMDPDDIGVSKLPVFAMAGEAEVVVVVGFRQLGSTGSSMGIVAIETENAGIEMVTPLKVKPLLVVGFRVGLRVSPEPGLKLVTVGQGVSYFVGFVVFVIPGELERPIWNTDAS